ITLLSQAPIESRIEAYSKTDGAVLQFLGVVREIEAGRLLEGIRYSCYEPMARAFLDKMVARMQATFGYHALYFHHRIGFVSVGEPSVIIRVGTPHSPQAFSLCQAYLQEVKQRLPIWKEPVFVESARLSE